MIFLYEGTHFPYKVYVEFFKNYLVSTELVDD